MRIWDDYQPSADPDAREATRRALIAFWQGRDVDVKEEMDKIRRKDREILASLGIRPEGEE